MCEDEGKDAGGEVGVVVLAVLISSKQQRGRPGERRIRSTRDDIVSVMVGLGRKKGQRKEHVPSRLVTNHHPWAVRRETLLLKLGVAFSTFRCSERWDSMREWSGCCGLANAVGGVLVEQPRNRSKFGKGASDRM